MKQFKKLVAAASLALLTGAMGGALASCKEEKEMVTYVFNTNGGVEISDVAVELGQTYALPTPEREGYNFLGWYTTETFEGEPVSSVVAEGNVTYYAKWEKLWTVTLNLGGGTLEGVPNGKIYLKNGVNLYEAVKNYVPTKGTLTFGAWFVGERELVKSRTVTSDMTLTAKYKVGYTVEIWLPKADGSGYVKSEESSVKYNYVGTNIESKPELEGYTEIEHENTVKEKVLTENAAENVFKHYFEQSVEVTFMPNYPKGVAGLKETVVVKKGEGVTVPDYTMDGYVLIGWSTKKDGALQYANNHLDKKLTVQGSVDSTKLIPTEKVTLYAVWAQVYTDIFGSEDKIYLYNENADGVVYLLREGLLFKGAYTAADKSFVFKGDDNTVVLQGKVQNGISYTYQNSERAEKSYLLFEDKAIVKSTKIELDAYNGVTYSVTEEDGTVSTSKGTYIFNDDDHYEATFTEGGMANKKMIFIVGVATEKGEQYDSFQVRNDAELDLGELVSFALDKNGNLRRSDEATLTLNGYGMATYKTNAGSANYNYTLEDDLLTLTSGTQTVMTVRIMTINRQKGYAVYTDWADGTFEVAEGGTLTLNGISEGTYKTDSSTVTGWYTTETSAFGGVIVTLHANNDKVYKFALSNEASATEESKGAYSAKLLSADYAEYRYLHNGKVYTSVLLVIESQNEASLYGYNTVTDELEQVSKGSYTANDDGYYAYTVTEYFDRTFIADSPLDPSKVQSFVFALDRESTSYSVTYWKASVETDGTVGEHVTEYKTKDGSATLTLVDGFAFYKKDIGDMLSGAYTTIEDGYTTLLLGDEACYIKLDEENHTFVELKHLPYQVYLRNEEGDIDFNVYLMLDGEGGAKYTFVTTNEDGEEVSKSETYGKVDITGDLTFNARIYTFTAEDNTITFKFIEVTAGGVRCFGKYSDTYSGEYTSLDGATFSVDGFGYIAKYNEFGQDKISGAYIVEGENFIGMLMGDTYRYFDLKEDKTFTMRGEEYGSYLLVENGLWHELYLEFDGYDKLTVYTMEKVGDTDEYERKDLCEGTYQCVNDVYTLQYTLPEQAATVLVGELGTITLSGNVYKAFTVSDKDAVNMYIDHANWSMLMLEDFGKATKLDAQGVKTEGKYVLITENLLFFEGGNESCIYKYDTEKGTATAYTFETVGYYTADLDTLFFYEYGLAVFNGETRRYYYEDNGVITVYTYDENNASAYGFTAEEFFTNGFETSKNYNGKNYYVNDGLSISFARAEGNTSKYDDALANLTFQPSGQEEFTVNGTVVYDGEKVDCTVTREVAEEGDEATMYVIIGDYHFDIEVTYDGENNTYQVLGMRYERQVYSNTYLNLNYQYLVNYNVSISNSYGSFVICYEYDEAGNVTARSVKEAVFGKSSGLTDENGDVIAFENATYAYDESTDVHQMQFTAKDGFVYRLYFNAYLHTAYNVYGYTVTALTRLQTATTNGYTVEYGRVLTTEEDSIEIGDVYLPSIVLKQGENVLKADRRLLIDGKFYYIVKGEEDENGAFAVTMYEITIADGETPTVTVESQTTDGVKSADGKTYIGVKDGKVVLLALYRNTYIVTESTLDGTTYTIKTLGGKRFTVSVENGVAVMKEIA
ncbi:MAG: InlB B-repeat-containing protein [Clostridia bacterium]|nr:InlB B-repeat-containing protein [Clostridia bacterium]